MDKIDMLNGKTVNRRVHGIIRENEYTERGLVTYNGKTIEVARFEGDATWIEQYTGCEERNG